MMFLEFMESTFPFLVEAVLYLINFVFWLFWFPYPSPENGKKSSFRKLVL
jgi:hypothetical protein